jgi:hypothetical protein
VEDLNEEEFVQHEYRASAREMKDRLDLMGFTIGKSRREFDRLIGTVLDDSPHIFRRHGVDVPFTRPTFDDWIGVVRTIINAKPEYPYDEFLANHPDPLFVYVLSSIELITNVEVICGYPATDERQALRAILEAVDENAEVSYDFSDLVAGGYLSAEEDHCDAAIAMVAQEYTSASNIVLLTEGTFDAEVLRGSLSVLYPHLTGFIDVMDFTTTAVAGGASFLVHTVKAFAGFGVRNRIVAIFDNDTEGTQAVQQLTEATLPKNIHVVQLPNTELADLYPTIGPQGERKMNVSGLASSIELFLGRDVLRRGDSFAPIQWRGFNPRVGQYQGEISDKTAIQRTFLDKLARQESQTTFVQKDWHELSILWETILRATPP